MLFKKIVWLDALRMCFTSSAVSSQEMASEKAKAAAGEAKVKKQLVAREQEIEAVQARMQASYRDHMKEVQQLQGKVGTGTSRSERVLTAQRLRLRLGLRMSAGS